MCISICIYIIKLFILKAFKKIIKLFKGKDLTKYQPKNNKYRRVV